MSISKVLKISRVSYADSTAFVEFEIEEDSTLYFWSCSVPQTRHRMHHEIVLLHFIVSNIEALLSNVLYTLEIDSKVRFSKTFKDVFELIQNLEPRLKNRLRIRHDSHTLVHPVFELGAPNGLGDREALAPGPSNGEVFTNIRIIERLLDSVIMDMDAFEPMGEAVFAGSMIWTVENSRSSFTNGLPATRVFLDVFERALRSLIGRSIILTVDLVDEFEYSSRLSHYTDLPNDFEEFFSLRRQGKLEVESGRWKSLVPETNLTELLSLLPSMDNAERRTIITLLPTGLAGIFHQVLPEFSPRFEQNVPKYDYNDEYFLTKKGWARPTIGEINVAWGFLYEEV